MRTGELTRLMHPGHRGEEVAEGLGAVCVEGARMLERGRAEEELHGVGDMRRGVLCDLHSGMPCRMHASEYPYPSSMGNAICILL